MKKEEGIFVRVAPFIDDAGGDVAAQTFQIVIGLFKKQREGGLPDLVTEVDKIKTAIALYIELFKREFVTVCLLAFDEKKTFLCLNKAYVQFGKLSRHEISSFFEPDYAALLQNIE